MEIMKANKAICATNISSAVENFKETSSKLDVTKRYERKYKRLGLKNHS